MRALSSNSRPGQVRILCGSRGRGLMLVFFFYFIATSEMLGGLFRFFLLGFYVQMAAVYTTLIRI